MKYAAYCFIFVAVLAGAFGSGYFLGKSNAKVEYVTKKIEVIKYVEKKKAVIHAVPNASRDDILNLMRSGKF